MRTNRVRLLLVAAAIALISGLLGVPTAQADPSLDEIILRLEHLRPIKKAILDRSGDWDGYAGMRIDPATRTIQVQWKGTISSDAHEFLNSKESQGVRVVVQNVIFTEAELKAESIRLVQSGAARMASHADDLSGLLVIPAEGAQGVPDSRYPVTVLPGSAMPQPAAGTTLGQYLKLG